MEFEKGQICEIWTAKGQSGNTGKHVQTRHKVPIIHYTILLGKKVPKENSMGFF